MSVYQRLSELQTRLSYLLASRSIGLADDDLEREVWNTKQLIAMYQSELISL